MLSESARKRLDEITEKWIELLEEAPYKVPYRFSKNGDKREFHEFTMSRYINNSANSNFRIWW